MNKTELIGRIMEISNITKRDSELALKAILSKVEENPITTVHQSRYDFVNSNRKKSKKGKKKKNWE